MQFLRLSSLAFVLFSLSSVLGALVNVTIDDTNGDPTNHKTFTYSPQQFWNVGTQCKNCDADLDPSQTFDGTWHDSSFTNTTGILSASVEFTGSAVYVFCILTGSTSNPNGNSDFLFKIDGSEVGTFIKQADGNSDFTYNVPVYANDALDDGQHTFTMEIGHSGGNSLVLFDRLVYSTNNNTQNNASSSNSTTFTTTETLSPIAPSASASSSKSTSASASASTSTSGSASSGQQSHGGHHGGSHSNNANNNSPSADSTSESPGIRTSQGPTSGLIAGLVVIIVVFVGIVVATLFYIQRRRRRQASHPKIRLAGDFRVMPWPAAMEEARGAARMPTVTVSRSVSVSSNATHSTWDQEGKEEGSEELPSVPSFIPSNTEGTEPDVMTDTDASDAMSPSLPNPFNDQELRVTNGDGQSTQDASMNYSRPIVTRKPVPPVSPSMLILNTESQGKVKHPLKTPPPSYFP